MPDEDAVAQLPFHLNWKEMRDGPEREEDTRKLHCERDELLSRVDQYATVSGLFE